MLQHEWQYPNYTLFIQYGPDSSDACSLLARTSQRVASRAGARVCEDKARADLSAETYSCSTSSTPIKRNAVLTRHRARVVATR